jgi:prophage regulatory protein
MKLDQSMPRLLRWRELCKIVPFSRSYVYVLMSQGKFPKTYKLVRGGKAVGWLASDIEAYLADLVQNEQ